VAGTEDINAQKEGSVSVHVRYLGFSLAYRQPDACAKFRDFGEDFFRFF